MKIHPKINFPKVCVPHPNNMKRSHTVRNTASCVSNHPLRTLHRTFQGDTRGRATLLRTAIIWSVCFNAQETTGLRGPRKNHPRNPVTSQPRPELKRHLRNQDSLRVAPGTRSRSGWKGRGSPTDGTAVSRRRSPPAAGSGACSSAPTPWSCPVGDGRRSHSEAPLSSQEKQLQGRCVGS